MMNKLSIILCITFFLLSKQSKSQDYSHRQLTTEDGLPTNYVYGVIEDEDGYIWVYTEKGISKFDGYQFKNYSVADGLPVNDIFIIHKNKDDMLWMFGIENSVGYIKNDSIFSIALEAPNRISMRNFEGGISYRSNNIIWKAKGEELIKTKIVDKHYNGYSKLPSQTVAEIKSLNESFQFDFKNGILKEHKADKLISETNFSRINPEYATFSRLYYCNTENPYYLIFGKQGFLLVDERTKEPTYTLWKKHFQNRITRWNVSFVNQEALVSTNSGLISISANREIKTYDFPNLGKQYSLRRSYKDANQNVWIGTQDGGLFFFSSEQLQANIINSNEANDNLFKRIVKTSTGHNYAITSKGTVYDIDENKLIKKVYKDASVYHAQIHAHDQLVLSSSNKPLEILCLEEQSCKKQIIDPKLLSFDFLPQEDYFPINRMANIKGIIIRDEKDLLVNNSIELFNASIKNDIPQYKTIANKQRLIYQSPFTSSIYTADKENLYSLNDNDELVKLFALPLISTICPFGNSGFLIGTESAGLYEYNFDDNQLNKIGDYGSTTQIHNHQNNIYTSSNEGIFKLEKKEKEFKVTKFWGINQGLPSLEVFDFLIEEDKLIACTNNGIAKISLNQKETKKENQNSKLLIHETKINDQELIDGMTVHHTKNDLSINFGLHDIKSFGKIKYRYKLNPIQNEWQTTSDRQVIFNNLSPDNYSFSLEAFDNNNTLYQLENNFSFTIKRAFWRTFPFYLGLLILSGFTYYILDRRRKQNLHNEVQAEKEQNRRIANLKLEALRSQMNPHFVFNALGAIQYYIQTHKINEADNYLTLFANLMRKYLNSSSEQLISIHDELSLITDYINLEKMRFENLFKTEIIIDPDIDINGLMIPSMMIQPYVENAINHGLLHRKDGKALLKVCILKDTDENIIIEIKDNGIGIENAKKNKKKFHKSKAMQNTAERIKSLNEAELVSLDINITNNSNDNVFPGTLVVINLKKQTQWNTPQLL